MFHVVNSHGKWTTSEKQSVQRDLGMLACGDILHEVAGWRKYRTTEPLVPENLLTSQKMFPQESKKYNCNNLDKRRNSEEIF
jgi:hypothetical protein